MKEKLINIYILFFCFLSTLAIDVSTLEEFNNALKKAKPGQVISIAPGEYNYSEIAGKIRFDLYADGTKSSPITITAKDPNNPPLLKGSDISVLHITGNFWVIDNVRLSGSMRGITIENSSYNIIRNVEIFNVGSSGVHVRGISSHNLFINCYIHNTGRTNPLFGTGISIGKAIDEVRFTFDTNYNVVDGCIFRNTTSEAIKIHEYTTGNEIVGNTFFADEINGKNGGDCFVTVSGDNNYIGGNVAYRNLNQNITAAFKVSKQVEDSGDGNKFVNNILFMDTPNGGKKNDKRLYIVDGVNTKFDVKNNFVDYGEGLIEANTEEYYNFDSITFLE